MAVVEFVVCVILWFVVLLGVLCLSRALRLVFVVFYVLVLPWCFGCLASSLVLLTVNLRQRQRCIGVIARRVVFLARRGVLHAWRRVRDGRRGGMLAWGWD
mgnify:CR=1 FL=1